MGEPAMTDSGPRPTSTPPEAKVVGAWATAVTLVLTAVAEIAGMCLASGLLYAERISVELWAGMMFYCLGGNVIAKARGKVPVPTTVALAAGVAFAAKHLHITLVALAAIVAALIAGVAL